MATEKADKGDKVTETVDGVPTEENTLTRKRTRDDFEEDQKEDEGDAKPERKIAQLKRRKDTTEEKPEAEEPAKAGTSEEVTEEVAEVDSEKKTEQKVEEKKGAESKDEVKEEEPKREDKPEEKVEKKTEDTTSTKTEATEPAKDTTETKKEPEKPKFVFGSTTPFGANAFSMINKNKNVFDSSNDSSKASTPGTPSVFGSNSKFGNAFQSAITKKNIFDKTPEEREKEKDEVKKSRETTPSITGNLYKQVDLEKKEIKSGEEDEEQVFTCRAKLYALDLANVKEGWKERGIGNIHVNRAQVFGKNSRIIMRSIGLLKVILNTPLIEGLEIERGMPSSLASEKFIRITVVEAGKPIQYALKTGNPETTTELYEAIDDLIPKSV